MSLMPNDFAKGVQKLASAWFDVVPADRGDWQDVRALESVRLRFRTPILAFPMLIWEYRVERIVSESPKL